MSMKHAVVYLLFAMLLFSSCIAKSREKTLIHDPSLARVIVKKELSIGVDPSMPPLSFYASNGELVGYEVDIARKIADTLGVGLNVVPITSQDRFEKLESHTIDYLASDFAFSDIINFDSNFLISDRFINIPAAKLKNISLKSDKLNTELKVELVERLHENNDLVKDKHGNIIYDIWISADGKRKNGDEFLSTYQDLLHLNAISFSSKADLLRKPKYEIIFETFSQKYTHKLYENKYNYSLYINDVSVYEFDKAKIDSLFEKLLNLSQIQ